MFDGRQPAAIKCKRSSSLRSRSVRAGVGRRWRVDSQRSVGSVSDLELELVQRCERFDCFVGCLVECFVGCLVECFVGCSVVCFVGSSVGCFVGWFVVCVWPPFGPPLASSRFGTESDLELKLVERPARFDCGQLWASHGLRQLELEIHINSAWSRLPRTT